MDGSPEFHNPTMRGIAVEERREILRTLIAEGPLPESALAERLSARDRGPPAPDAGRERTAHAGLVHSHLPTLRAAGLIAWNRDGGTVETADHPALADPRFEQLLEIESEGSDDVFVGLSHEYRRIALTSLWDGRPAKRRRELANEILRCRDRDGGPDPGAEGRVDLALHHVHLPVLSDVDLVEYDAATDRVVYTDDPVLEEVFTIVYRPVESIGDRYDGFLAGLRDVYREMKPEGSYLAGWPHEWREPNRG